MVRTASTAPAGVGAPPRILIADPVAAEGIALLQQALPDAQIDVLTDLSPERLRQVIGRYTALLVRSATQVTAELLSAAPHLRIVGRVGVGLDNIDIESATSRGIRVVSSPTGNVVAAAEHTMAMILALARHIPAATQSMKEGRWEKSRFLGSELRHKVLGIIGLGKVGSEVASCARGLHMRVIACDPYVSAEHARCLGVPLLGLEDVLRQADVVTLHVTLAGGPEGTRGLLGARELRLLKPGAFLINCACGGLIDEVALLQALREERLAGVALDVFSSEPVNDDQTLCALLADPRVIATPHLGASTVEAQRLVAVDVAAQVAAALRELNCCPA